MGYDSRGRRGWDTYGRSGYGSGYSSGAHSSASWRAAPAPVDKSGPSFQTAIKDLKEASEPSEWAWRCVAAVLDHTFLTRDELEVALSKFLSWVSPTPSSSVLAQVASSSVPSSVVYAMKKFRSEPPVAALTCLAILRSSGNADVAASYVEAGAVDEIGSLMDLHSTHGGVQNVSLLALSMLLKDHLAARHANYSGMASRVIRAMESSAGREIQYNGLQVMRLLTDRRAPHAGLQEAGMRAKVVHPNDSDICLISNDVLALVTPRFKEVQCWHWQSGWCKLGPRCSYAHGSTDLRTG